MAWGAGHTYLKVAMPRRSRGNGVGNNHVNGHANGHANGIGYDRGATGSSRGSSRSDTGEGSRDDTDSDPEEGTGWFCCQCDAWNPDPETLCGSDICRRSGRHRRCDWCNTTDAEGEIIAGPHAGEHHQREIPSDDDDDEGPGLSVELGPNGQMTPPLGDNHESNDHEDSNHEGRNHEGGNHVGGNHEDGLPATVNGDRSQQNGQSIHQPVPSRRRPNYSHVVQELEAWPLILDGPSEQPAHQFQGNIPFNPVPPQHGPFYVRTQFQQIPQVQYSPQVQYRPEVQYSSQVQYRPEAQYSSQFQYETQFPYVPRFSYGPPFQYDHQFPQFTYGLQFQYAPYFPPLPQPYFQDWGSVDWTGRGNRGMHSDNGRGRPRARARPPAPRPISPLEAVDRIPPPPSALYPSPAPRRWNNISGLLIESDEESLPSSRNLSPTQAPANAGVRHGRPAAMQTLEMSAAQNHRPASSRVPEVRGARSRRQNITRMPANEGGRVGHLVNGPHSAPIAENSDERRDTETEVAGLVYITIDD